MPTTDVTEGLPAGIDHLLDNLQAVTPAQMASLLQEVRASLKRTEWVFREQLARQATEIYLDEALDWKQVQSLTVADGTVI